MHHWFELRGEVGVHASYAAAIAASVLASMNLAALVMFASTQWGWGWLGPFEYLYAQGAVMIALVYVHWVLIRRIVRKRNETSLVKIHADDGRQRAKTIRVVFGYLVGTCFLLFAATVAAT